MLTLAFPDPPTTLDEETDEGKGTDDDYRIEDDLNQYREGCSCYSMEPEMGRVSRIWQHVFRGPHTWVSKDTFTGPQIRHSTKLYLAYVSSLPARLLPALSPSIQKQEAGGEPACKYK